MTADGQMVGILRAAGVAGTSIHQELWLKGTIHLLRTERSY
jgi:hypothetical protein